MVGGLVTGLRGSNLPGQHFKITSKPRRGHELRPDGGPDFEGGGAVLQADDLQDKCHHAQGQNAPTRERTVFAETRESKDKPDDDAQPRYQQDSTYECAEQPES